MSYYSSWTFCCNAFLVYEPKYDIRDWSPDGTRMGKGISLSHDELAILNEKVFWKLRHYSNRFN